MKNKLFILSVLTLVLFASCKKTDPSKSVRDICGNAYPIVTIGSQTWMAENMKCNKYDTESEAYKAGTKSISTSDVKVFTPYYTDATDKKKWETKYGDYAGNLSNLQISKLGYQYNWAAAVGLADGQSQKTAFSGTRQGICPNGWHVPTVNDWDVLANFVTNSGAVGKSIKTTSGWYQNGSGTDNYNFAALPAGNVMEVSVTGVGRYAYFCTSTPCGDNNNAHTKTMSYDKDNLGSSNFGKNCGTSVRCIKN